MPSENSQAVSLLKSAKTWLLVILVVAIVVFFQFDVTLNVNVNHPWKRTSIANFTIGRKQSNLSAKLTESTRSSRSPKFSKLNALELARSTSSGSSSPSSRSPSPSSRSPSTLTLPAQRSSSPSPTLLPSSSTPSSPSSTYSSPSSLTNKPKITIKAGDKTYDLIWCPILHLYRINDKPVLWLFWDKKPLPLHIKLSLATILCHNENDFHLQIVSEPELSAWIGVIHPAYQFLIPAHKADYFRGRVLANYGGMYLDADTIGLHNLKHLFDKLKEYDVVNIDWSPDGDDMAISVMGPMRANTVVMTQFAQKQDEILHLKLPSLQKTKSGGQYPLGWAEILRSITLPLVKRLLNEKAFRYYKMSGPRTFGQLTASGFKPSTQLSKTKQYTITDTELLMYHNSGMSGNVRNMNKEQFLQSDMLLPTIIRFSMKRCKDNNLKDFSLETKLRIGEDVRNFDKDLVKWIIDYTKNKMILN